MKTSRIALAGLVALATPTLLPAQGLVVTAGPDPVPLRGRAKISFTNTSDLIATLISCPWEIVDSDMNLVYTPECLPFEVLFSSLGVINQTWNLRDNDGEQVPPGDYFVRAFIEFEPSQLVPLTVGGVDANLTVMGLPNIATIDVGGGRRFFLNAPEDPEQPFLLLASFGSDGIDTCAGTLPLSLDPLLVDTLSGSSTLPGAAGVLDNIGASESPVLPLPDNPALIGLGLTTAFVVLDLESTCPIRTISASHDIVIEGGAIPF